MKKLSALFICILSSIPLYAQLKFIPKAGVSWSTISFNEDINDQVPGDFDYGYKAGFMIGMAIEIPIVPGRFSIQPELLFHQKGYTQTYADQETSESYKTTLNYLEVYSLARLNLGKFYLAAGPSVAFGGGGKYNGTNTYMGNTVAHEGKVKFGEAPYHYNGSNVYVNALDIGMQLAAGIDLNAVVIDLRYGLGLSDIFDETDLNTDTRNRSLQLTVGIPIAHKK